MRSKNRIAFLFLSLLVFLSPLSFVQAEFSSTPDATSIGVGGGVQNGFAIVATTSAVYVGTASQGYAISPINNSSISSFVTSVAPGNGFSIKSEALSPDGRTLYIGGQFATVNGIAHNRIAAINTSDGTASTTWTFAGVDGFGQVSAITISPDGNTVYIGGNFTSINYVTYNYLAALNAYTGAVITAFNPSLDSSVNALTISPDGHTLYVGGQFTTVGGATFNRIAAINTTTASGTPSFNPNLDGSVNALSLTSDGTTLYVGGAFSTIGGVTYNRVAALNTSNGTASTTFNPNVNNTVNALALSPTTNSLYVGGTYTAIGGVTYNRLASISTLTASATPAFNPNVASSVSALALQGNKLFAVGSFASVGGNTSYTKFASFTATGITLSKTSSSLTEGGASDTYTVVLNAAPSSNVTVTLTPGSGLTTDVSSLTFTSANYATPQTVTVTAPANGVVDGTHTASITQIVTSSDSNYSGMSVSPITATITDATTPPVVTAVPDTGTFTAAQSVTLSASTTASSIHYTLDGSSPTCSTGTTYSGAISVSSTQTIKARACYLSDTIPSAVTTLLYTLNIPVASVARTTSVGSGGSSATYLGVNPLYVRANISPKLSFVSFSQPLQFSVTSTDVKRLQQFLNSQGFLVAKNGPGSPGNETTFFGSATKAALVKFQEYYQAEILSPNGLQKGTGYFGPATMKKVNEVGGQR